MWFDVSAAVVQLHEGRNRTLLSKVTENDAPNVIRITERNAHQVAEIAEVAAPCAKIPELGSVARTDRPDPDAGKYLDFLHLHGPSNYGASATALGWGATRTWQAEAQLLAAGLVQHDSLGKAEPKPDKSVSSAVQNQCLNPPVAPKIRATLSEPHAIDGEPNA